MLMTLIAVAALGEPAALSEKDAALLARYTRTGEILTCLPSSTQNDFTAIGDSMFLVRSGNRYYLTETRGSCKRADDPFHRIELVIRGGQICRNQIVNVVDSSGFFAGSCGLGDFERLERAPKAAADEGPAAN